MIITSKGSGNKNKPIIHKYTMDNKNCGPYPNPNYEPFMIALSMELMNKTSALDCITTKRWINGGHKPLPTSWTLHIQKMSHKCKRKGTQHQ